MSDARHRRARHRRPRPQFLVLVPRIAKLAAPGAALALLAGGSAAALPDQSEPGPKETGPTASAGTQDSLATNAQFRADRSERSSRSATRSAAPDAGISGSSGVSDGADQPGIKPSLSQQRADKPTPEVTDSKFVTTDLNMWTEPEEEGKLLDVLEPGAKVKVTDREDGEWAEIVRDGEPRWVRADYLAQHKPSTEDESSDDDTDGSGSSSGGLSTAECSNGADVEESNITEDAVRVYRAVCHQFPSLDNYLTTESGSGEHGEGRAVDIMIDDSSLGDEVADWLQANHEALGISELIWQQQIWTVQRSSEGWRGMEDRGSPSANHMDHVHVTVYGSSGSA